jgi:hypothetical protein
MAVPTSLLQLIHDGNGQGLTSFLTTTADLWADHHMIARYRIGCTPEDPPGHFAVLCRKKLVDEYTAVRGWFQDDGRFSPLLSSHFFSQAKSGPIGDGIGWDFGAGGEINPQMLQFKCSMLAAVRTLDGIPRSDLQQAGCAPLGTVMHLAASAYTARAAIHRWQPFEVEEDGKRVVKYTGAEMSKRWVTFKVYSLLTSYGVPHTWAWGATKAKQVFGPTDEERLSY